VEENYRNALFDLLCTTDGDLAHCQIYGIEIRTKVVTMICSHNVIKVCLVQKLISISEEKS